MKKINLLIPILTISTTASAVVPMVTSCSNYKTEITEDMLNIRGSVLYGLKKDVDISTCNTLIIPEGVKFIEAEAFNGLFALGTKGSKVRTIIFPSSLSEVRKNAFANCDALRVLDFTSWSVNQIYYCNFAVIDDQLKDGAFSGSLPGGQIIFNSEATNESKKELTTRLAYSGLWVSWSLDESKDRIEVENNIYEQTKPFGKADYLFKLKEKLVDNTYLLATVTLLTGTDGVDVFNASEKAYLEPNEDNSITLPVSLFNHLNAGDHAIFNIAFTAITYTSKFGLYEPVWKQTLSGFKLVNESKMVSSLKLESDKIDLKVDETTKVVATVSPEDATDKTVTFKSENDNIATVDQDGNVTAKAVGEVKIVGKANGGANVTQSITIKVSPKE